MKNRVGLCFRSFGNTGNRSLANDAAHTALQVLAEGLRRGGRAFDFHDLRALRPENCAGFQLLPALPLDVVYRPARGRDSGQLLDSFETPHGASGFLEKRRIEHQQATLGKSLRAQIAENIERLEELLEAEPRNFALQCEMGGWCLIDGAHLRAAAHLESAHKLQPDDFNNNINLGIARAKLGKFPSALELLQKVCNAHPKAPLPIFNFATIALQARHYEMVLEATKRLEVLRAQRSRCRAVSRRLAHPERLSFERIGALGRSAR